MREEGAASLEFLNCGNQSRLKGVNMSGRLRWGIFFYIKFSFLNFSAFLNTNGSGAQ